jgi:hypothetical protein
MGHWKVGCHAVVVSLLLFVCGAECASAANAPVIGDYELVQKVDLGSHTRVLLRLHLTNRGGSAVYLERILLADFGHPLIPAPRGSAMVLHSHTSELTTQEFVIPRLQFDEWRRGLRPKVILGLRTASGARYSQAIRLDRAPARKGE